MKYFKIFVGVILSLIVIQIHYSVLNSSFFQFASFTLIHAIIWSAIFRWAEIEVYTD